MQDNTLKKALLSEALNILSRRSLSEQELALLLRKKFNEISGASEITPLIEYLKSLGYLDDFRLASSLARRHAHKGNHFIFAYCHQKGIPDTAISEALTELEDEASRAKLALTKKIKHRTFENHQKMFAYTMRFLGGRGFSKESILLALKEYDVENIKA